MQPQASAKTYRETVPPILAVGRVFKPLKRSMPFGPSAVAFCYDLLVKPCCRMEANPVLLIDRLWLKFGSDSVRKDAVTRIGQSGKPEGVSALSAVLRNDKAYEVKAAVVPALGGIPTIQSARVLLAELPHMHRSWRGDAFTALEKIGARCVPEDVESSSFARGLIWHWIKADFMPSESARFRSIVVEFLGTLRWEPEDDEGRALLAVLRPDSIALNSSTPPGVVDALIRAYEHCPGSKDIAVALAASRETKALETLRKKIASSNHWSACHAIKETRVSDQSIISELVSVIRTIAVGPPRSLEDATFFRLQNAAETLAELEDASAIPVLIDLLAWSSVAANHALTKLGKRVVEPLLNLLETTTDDDLRLRVLERLQEIGDERGIRRGAEILADIQTKDAERLRHDDEFALRKLIGLCKAYTDGDKRLIRYYEPIAADIGTMLHARGGLQEMRRVFQLLNAQPGSRTLEMHWNEIGEWRG